VDTEGCFKSIVKKLDEPSPMEFESIKVVNPSCYGVNDGIIEIYAKGGTINEIEQYSYSIDGGKTFSKKIRFTDLSPKIYDIVVKDINECFVFRKVTLKEPPLIRVHAKTFGIDTIMLGESVNLYYTTSSQFGDTPITKIVTWTPNESLSCSDCDKPIATPYISTKYTLTMIYNNNCISSSKVNVVVRPILGVYVPNAFTPGNQDGVNDVFRIFGTAIKTIDFKVFNRWGEKVFESNTQEKTWDGSFKNSPAPSGAYPYSLYVEYLNGFSETKKGTISLIR
jgi:gliding motility-associated-like protein